MAASKATTSINAAPGRWNPVKKSHYQAALRAEGEPLPVIFSTNEPHRHGHHGDLERGPMIQLGGFHVGLAKSVYLGDVRRGGYGADARSREGDGEEDNEGEGLSQGRHSFALKTFYGLGLHQLEKRLFAKVTAILLRQLP